jgi:putative ABC transport system permease protein
MFQNYLKIALRTLLRNKLYSGINIVGFALGIACCLAIMLWVQHEWNFNRFHAKLGRIHRVLQRQKVSNAVNVYQTTAGPFAEVAKADIPEVEQVAQVLPWDNVLGVGNAIFREEGVYANSVLFTMFSFPLLAGNAATALDEPNAIALSETLARKLFGSADVVGKTVRLNAKTDCKVTAVFRDVPKTSSLKFEYALSVKDFIKANAWAEGWDNNTFRTYFLLREGAEPTAVNAQLRDFLARKIQLHSEQSLFIQPFGESYVFNKFENGVQQGGRIETLRTFTLIAAMVLALACVNFMNLTTARGMRRSKEIGIRKSVGATRSTLIVQMLGESVLTALLALPIAVLLVELALPALKELTGATLHIPFGEAWFWAVLPVFGVVVGFISGLYPALSLSSFQAVSVLKGTMKSGPGAVALRRGLVVFEFAIAIAFIAGTIVIYRQIEFIKTKNLGLDRENVASLTVDIPEERFAAWKQELKAQSAIVSVAGSGEQSSLEVGSNTSAMNWKGQLPNEKIMVGFHQGDYAFLETMNIQLSEGRAFSPAFAADSVNYIVNETCVRQMRLAHPIGETLRWGFGADARVGTIVGVVKDFHFSSLHEAIEPIMITLIQKTDRILVRFAKGKTEEGLNALRSSFTKYQPGLPFDVKFLDDEYNEMYKSETMIGRLALSFAVLAVAICSLGLFGLAAFMAETRTKEIGIRKVLGASVASIVGLLSKDFLVLVGIAIVIATPLAYWFAGKWLQDFAYKVELSWWVFVLAGVVAVVIAFATVATQAWKAARQNPVNALRSE